MHMPKLQLHTEKLILIMNDLKTSKKDFSQLKIKRKSHTEMDRRGKNVVWPGHLSWKEERERDRKPI